jgi:hypothetical protein
MIKMEHKVKFGPGEEHVYAIDVPAHAEAFKKARQNHVHATVEMIQHGLKHTA